MCFRGEQGPVAGDALEGAGAAVGEAEAGAAAGDQVLHRARAPGLVGPGLSQQARGRVDGDADDGAVDEFDLPGGQAAADVEAAGAHLAAGVRLGRAPGMRPAGAWGRNPLTCSLFVYRVGTLAQHRR